MTRTKEITEITHLHISLAVKTSSNGGMKSIMKIAFSGLGDLTHCPRPFSFLTFAVNRVKV